MPPLKVLAERKTLELTTGSGRVWLSGTGDSGASAADHSCHPNSELFPLMVGGTYIAVLSTTRRVKKGARVTVRYSFKDAAELGVKCRCSARQCCGVMGCTTKLHNKLLAAAK